MEEYNLFNVAVLEELLTMSLVYLSLKLSLFVSGWMNNLDCDGLFWLLFRVEKVEECVKRLI